MLHTILFALSVLPIPALAQRDQGWQQDIQFFARELPARHGNFFENVTRDAFDAAIRDLSDRVPQLTDGQITAGLLRIAAMARDSHTSVFHNLAMLPVEVMWMTEGLFITASSHDLTELIGARVLKINETTVEDALAQVAPLISHENSQRLKARSQAVLVTTPLLFAAGILPEPSKAVLELEMPGGELRFVELPWSSKAARVTFVTAGKRTEGYVPLGHRDAVSNYWYEYLADARTLYVAFNHSREDYANQFVSFANGMIQDLQGKPVEKVIVDLRYNSGGALEYFDAMVKFAKQSSLGEAKYFGLIGRDTFSAGMFHAYQLQQELAATLIGESTGGKPWAWGYVGQFTLPYSGLVTQYSTTFYRLTPEDREWLAPDIPVEIRAPEYFNRFDALFAAALADGARRSASSIVELRCEDAVLNASDHRATAGSALRVKLSGESAQRMQIVIGHQAPEVLARRAVDDGYEFTVRVPPDLKGEVPVYAVGQGEVSSPVTAFVSARVD